MQHQKLTPDFPTATRGAALVRYDAACRALAEARSVDELKADTVVDRIILDHDQVAAAFADGSVARTKTLVEISLNRGRKKESPVSC